MTGQPAPPSSEPWAGEPLAAMERLPVPPPYTPDDLQAIADALCLSDAYAGLWTIAVPRPGVRVVMGEPCPPGPLSVIFCPLADAIQDSARLYLAHLRANAHPSRGPSRQNLTRVRRSAQRLMRAMQTFAADLRALDSDSPTLMALIPSSSISAYERLRRLEAWTRTRAEEAAEELSWFLTLVESTLPGLKPDPGGRPRDMTLPMFLKRLCIVYEWATGKPPRLSRDTTNKPSGPLFRFIRTCFTRLTPHTPLRLPWGEAWNAEALYVQIRTVLTRAKKEPIKTHRS